MIIAKNKWVLQADIDPAVQMQHACHQNQLNRYCSIGISDI